MAVKETTEDKAARKPYTRTKKEDAPGPEAANDLLAAAQKRDPAIIPLEEKTEGDDESLPAPKETQDTKADDVEDAPGSLEEVDENAGYPVYPKDNPAHAKATHEKRVASHGPDYVVAIRGNFQSVWSKLGWAGLDGKTEWKLADQMPEEVIAAKKKHK